MVLFESERLIARRIVTSDVVAMVAVYGDADTVRYVGDTEPLDTDGCFRWVEVTDRNFANRGYGMMALAESSPGEPIGFIGIVHPNQSEVPEIKYAFRRDQWGKGYATEAVRATVEYARITLKLSRLIATVDPRNMSSRNVLAKSGFRHSEDRLNDDESITQIWELD